MAPSSGAVARAMSTRKAAVKGRSARTRRRGEIEKVRRSGGCRHPGRCRRVNKDRIHHRRLTNQRGVRGVRVGPRA